MEGEQECKEGGQDRGELSTVAFVWVPSSPLTALTDEELGQLVVHGVDRRGLHAQQHLPGLRFRDRHAALRKLDAGTRANRGVHHRD
jgi:hypothetical protein